jgi:tetraacyldisaccharide 4'-kinase
MTNASATPPVAEDRVRRLLNGQSRGPAPSAARAGLAALSLAYTGGLKAYLWLYRSGIRRQAKLPRPVISIGNLTVGGAGKTPMTRSLCERLTERGLRLCVLSRGYRGENEHGVAIVSNTRKVLLNAAQAGDEAYWLAVALPGIPVLVGKDRRKSGALACREFQPDAIVLDDGMQYYQLHRDLDIVLVSCVRPFDNGWTLPRGLLREPPDHIARAHVVVLTHTDKVSPAAVDELARIVARLAPHASQFRAAYCVAELRPLDRSEPMPAVWLRGRPVATFCAVAQPESFERQVELAGGSIVSRTRLADHETPTMGHVEQAVADALAHGAEAILVSDKDAVKLPPLGRPLPFYSLAANLRVEREDELIDLAMRAVRP